MKKQQIEKMITSLMKLTKTDKSYEDLAELKFNIEKHFEIDEKKK